MIFTKLVSDAYACEDWCDIKQDEILIGAIGLSKDGHWRFNSARNVLLTDIHCKQIANKLIELNRDIVKEGNKDVTL